MSSLKIDRALLSSISNLSSDDELEWFLLDKLSLSSADLSSISLKCGVISHSNLSLVDFKKSYFKQVIFEVDDLNSAKFSDLETRECQFSDCRATGIIASDSKFKLTIFKNCKLDLTNFRMSEFQKVIFEDCDLSEADFYSAKLKSVQFINCRLEQTDFSRAELNQVDLSQSGSLIKLKGLDYLRGAIISQTQLTQLAPALATNLGIKVED